MSNTDTDTGAIDTTIIEWRDKGVGPGGIANALEAMGLGRWSAKDVGAALKRLGIKADTLRAAEAVFTPGEEGTAEDYEAEGWAGHCGEKFVRPWLDSTGRDVRDTEGAAGEQSDGGGDVDTTLADRALEHLERTEKDDLENPFESTAWNSRPTLINCKQSRGYFPVS